MEEHRLTTIDNPYDPFDQFESWFLYDESHGYHTCSRLGRIAKTNDYFSKLENNKEVEQAIDDIIAVDFMHIYKKVSRTVEY